MKILLVQPPGSKKEIVELVKYAPMGLIALAGYIRKHNDVAVDIYDANVQSQCSLETTVEYVLSSKSDLLGLTAATNSIAGAIAVASEVKRRAPGITVVLGGIHTTIEPEEVLASDCVDFIIVGEGEIAFSEFLRNFGREDTYPDIGGLGYKKDGKTCVNPRKELIQDLDSLPHPAYDLLEVGRYRSPYGTRAPFISMLRSRGCPFKCIFCGVQNMFGHSYRVQSPERTVDEIEYLVKEFGVREIGFKDSEFTLHTKNVMALCDLLIEKNYDLSWACNARVDRPAIDLFRKMKDAGCTTISFGAESGDDHILEAIKKGITVDQIRAAVANAKEAGLSVSVNFILGNPYDTRETIMKTINLAKETNPDYALFTFATPFPGTQLRDMAERNGWLLNPDLAAVEYMELCMNATDLSTEELSKYMDRAYKTFYFRPRYILRRLKRLRRDEIKTSILGLASILKKFVHSK